MFKQASMKSVVWSCLLGCVPVNLADAEAAMYYCPKGNVSMIADDTQMHGTANESFPLGPSINSDSKRSLEGKLYWQLKDCSNQEFMCYDVSDVSNVKRRLFVPRYPKLAQVYRYGSARAYVIPSTSSSKLPTIQVVVWQDGEGKKAPLKFTIQKTRGSIFIDGLNFWNDRDSSAGETCVLEAGVGYFRGVAVPKAPIKEITDY